MVRLIVNHRQGINEMHEEKGEKEEVLDKSADSVSTPNDEKTEVSLDFDDEIDIIQEDDGSFELPPVDVTEEALLLEKESVTDLNDRLLRLQAEFDNYRKRMNQRFSDAAQYASEGILLKLLDVYDNLERSLAVDFESNPSSARAGIEAIFQQMQKIFTAEEVRPIEALGKEFDPYYQNSINSIHDEEQPDKLVVEEYLKGYMIRDRVLRPASVCVNRHIPPPVIDETVEEISADEESTDEDLPALEASQQKDTNKESIIEENRTEEKGDQE